MKAKSQRAQKNPAKKFSRKKSAAGHTRKRCLDRKPNVAALVLLFAVRDSLFDRSWVQAGLSRLILSWFSRSLVIVLVACPTNRGTSWNGHVAQRRTATEQNRQKIFARRAKYFWTKNISSFLSAEGRKKNGKKKPLCFGFPFFFRAAREKKGNCSFRFRDRKVRGRFR